MKNLRSNGKLIKEAGLLRRIQERRVKGTKKVMLIQYLYQTGYHFKQSSRSVNISYGSIILNSRSGSSLAILWQLEQEDCQIDSK
jgi:hypothetical protein